LLSLRGQLCAAIAGAALLPGAVSAASTSLTAKDARLKQPVTTRVVDFPLRTWLEQLSRQTGVRLRDAADDEDRAITVRAAGMPLGDLMEAAAALLGDVWLARGKNAAHGYLLEPSLARRGRQRQLLDTYARVLQADLTREARAVAEKGPPPEEIAGTPAESEEARARYGAELKARARLVSLLGPEAMRNLLAGGRLRVRVAEAGGKLGEALRDFVESYAMPGSSDAVQQRASAWVEFSSLPYMLTAHAPGLPLRDLYWTVSSAEGSTSAFNMVVPGDEFAAHLARATAPLRRGEEQEPEERRREGGSMLQRRLPRDLKPPAGTPASRSELLLAIADAASLNLVSDSYTKPKLYAPALAGRCVEEAMTAVCGLHGCLWRAARGTLLVRSRYWWLDDRDEPPATAVARWQAALAQPGALDLDEACRIAVLPLEQRLRLSLRLPETQSASNPWLRLYGQINPLQRQAAGSPQGLPIAAIPEPLRLQVTASDPGHNPYYGRRRLEETLMEGPAMLKVEPAAEGRPAIRFLLQPLPDANSRHEGACATVFLPFRDRHANAAATGSAGPPVVDLR
jgi:hypothetical protein